MRWLVILGLLSCTPIVTQPIPKPWSADSLAGVLARRFPRQIDSTKLATIRWMERQAPDVGRVSICEYPWAFPQKGRCDRFTTVPTVGVVTRSHGIPTVTFAKGWQDSPRVTLHELYHALTTDPRWYTHPESVFRWIDLHP